MNISVTLRTFLGTAGLATLAALLPQGCSPEDILEVTDPDIVIEIPQTRGAALALYNGTFRRLAEAVTGTQGPDALFVFGGLLTDEWRSGDTFVQRNNQDQRIFEPANTFNQGVYRNINRVRVQAEIAIDALRSFAPTPDSNVGQMFALIAYVEVLIAEHYCNGTPLSEPDPVTPGAIIYGDRLSNDSVFSLAIAHADSALAHRAGSADSNEVKWLASIVKARAQVGKGQYAAAAATITAVGAIPDNFKYLVTHSLNVNDNQIWALNNNARRYTLVNREGGTGLDFVSAQDPRLPTRTGGSGTSGRIFDTQNPTPVIRQGIYGRTSAVPIATGVEARLIQAEAALRAGDFTTWLNTINGLRTTASLYAPREGATEVSPPAYVPAAGTVLSALTQPATDSLRIFAHFRERALWLFSTGHRLGDMRRLVRPGASGGYGWQPTGVFPVGPYYKGGAFGTALQMAVPFQETNNPLFVECLDLNP